MVIGVSTRLGVRGRLYPSPSYIWLSSCLRHAASGSRPFVSIRPVECCSGAMAEMKERYSKDSWISETNRLRLRWKKRIHENFTNTGGRGCTDLLPQYVDSKIGKEAVELGNVENERVHILTNHHQDIIHQVPTHTGRHNSPSMNESAVENKHRQSLRPGSRITLQNPHLERPILNLQLPQCDRVAEVVNDVPGGTAPSEKCFINDQHIKTSTTEPTAKDLQKVVHQEKTTEVHYKVIIVKNVSPAIVARLLFTDYKTCIHACDTEVANIDVKSDPPVGHGEIICFSIYSDPLANFGNGKSCVWVMYSMVELKC